MYEPVRNKLIKMGIRPNLMGFHFLCEAISRVRHEYLHDNWYIKFTDLYKEIGRKFHISEWNVERAMRTAISQRKDSHEHLSLSEFISEMADRLCYS